MNAVDGTDGDMQWNDSKEDENVRNVRNMKALTMKMEMVTVISKGRYNLTCYMLHA